MFLRLGLIWDFLWVKQVDRHVWKGTEDVRVIECLLVRRESTRETGNFCIINLQILVKKLEQILQNSDWFIIQTHLPRQQLQRKSAQEHRIYLAVIGKLPFWDIQEAYLTEPHHKTPLPSLFNTNATW